MILLRAALSQLFPHLDKILSLDCDTLIQDNISELWDLPLDDYYFAAVREPQKSTENFVYINVGVMMFNLKKIREEHQDDKYIYNLNNMDHQVLIVEHNVHCFYNGQHLL